MNFVRVLPLAMLLLACSSRDKEVAAHAPGVAAPVQAANAANATNVASIPQVAPQASRPLSAQEQVEQDWMRTLFGAAYDARARHALVELDIDGAPAPSPTPRFSSSAMASGNWPA